MKYINNNKRQTTINSSLAITQYISLSETTYKEVVYVINDVDHANQIPSL